jgi:hypothetical protein
VFFSFQNNLSAYNSTENNVHLWSFSHSIPFKRIMFRISTI